MLNQLTLKERQMNYAVISGNPYLMLNIEDKDVFDKLDKLGQDATNPLHPLFLFNFNSEFIKKKLQFMFRKIDYAKEQIGGNPPSEFILDERFNKEPVFRSLTESNEAANGSFYFSIFIYNDKMVEMIEKDPQKYIQVFTTVVSELSMYRHQKSLLTGPSYREASLGSRYYKILSDINIWLRNMVPVIDEQPKKEELQPIHKLLKPVDSTITSINDVSIIVTNEMGVFTSFLTRFNSRTPFGPQEINTVKMKALAYGSFLLVQSGKIGIYYPNEFTSYKQLVLELTPSVYLAVMATYTRKLASYKKNNIRNDVYEKAHIYDHERSYDPLIIADIIRLMKLL